MNDGFFDVKLLFATPQSFHDSSPQWEPIVSVADTKNMQFVGAIIGRPKTAFTS